MKRKHIINCAWSDLNHRCFRWEIGRRWRRKPEWAGFGGGRGQTPRVTLQWPGQCPEGKGSVRRGSQSPPSPQLHWQCQGRYGHHSRNSILLNASLQLKVSLDKVANIDTYVCFEGCNIERNREGYSGLSDRRSLNFYSVMFLTKKNVNIRKWVTGHT